jgi:signal transduction histidine kinase
MGSSEPGTVGVGPRRAGRTSDPFDALAGAHDWAATPLGPVEAWPDALRHAASLCMAAPDPAIVWWGRDQLQVYNAAAQQFYGAAHPRALGRMARSAPPAGWDVLGPLVAGVLATGNGATFEDSPYSLEGAAGPESCFCSGSLIPVGDGGGEVGGVLGLLRDCSARVLDDRQRRRQATGLAALDEARIAFLADIGREFVAPLSLMLGPLQALQGNARATDETGDHELFATVRRACLRLLRLVNALQQFARIETGQAHTNPEETDLAQFTTDLASIFRPAAEAAGLQLTVECPPLPWPVPVDRGMWEKIVLNLLSNAVKYTHQGEIAISLRAAQADADGAVVLQVRDTGVGIAPGDVARLFERYRRVRGSGGRTHEGLGIGLSLVRELTRLHGGEVAVESVSGQGSTFTVTIPVPAAQPATRAAPPTRAAPQAASPYVGEVLRWLPRTQIPARVVRSSDDAPGAADECVLVVSAHSDMRAYLRRLLAAHWAVVEAVGGGEAVATARANAPALILADMAALGPQGLALVRALRDDPGMAAVPVILLSPHADMAGTVGGLEAGADDVLAMPFFARELLARVRAHIDLARLRREAQVLREEFVAAAAHDLRTPLTSIQIGLSLLDAEATGMSSDARGVLEAVRRNAQRLAIHVGDLVTANQLNADLLGVQHEPLDLRDVAREAVAAVQPLFREKGQEIDLALPRPLPIWGDARRLEQVVVNLLVNAHRYTPVGTRVTIAGCADGTQVRLTVSDTGPGIPAEQLEQVFERHRRFQSGHGGSGLGLTIARSLTNLHGGRIWAESPPGGGARFHITLPHGRGDDRVVEEVEGDFDATADR